MKLDLSTPVVMAILNITPDSFYAASRTPELAQIKRRIEEAVLQGASILDIGGCSTRPGADEVPAEEEWRRVEAALTVVRTLAPALPVSIDTFRSEVAARAIDKFGALMINDISAGERDPQLLAVAAEYDVPYIAMHSRGNARTMSSLTDYGGDVTGAVAAWAERKIAELLAAGIRRERLILDPGFGFAKTVEQNYELLANLHRLCASGFPVLSGVSRKDFIYKVLDATPAESLAGTVALEWESLRQGASILRVHDVREAADTVKIYKVFRRQTADDSNNSKF